MTAEPQNDLEFLNIFAHDLKIPLSAIKSYVELIEVSGSLNERQKHFAGRSLQAVSRIQQMITDLLEYSRMQNGTAEIVFEDCDLAEITEEIIGFIDDFAAEKQVNIVVDIPRAAQSIYADPNLISHVLTNLISNAIKYNRVGGNILIRAGLLQDDVEISVKDTGLGIPPYAINQVFNRFYRVPRKEVEIEGTGLGLAIVQEIVQKHGGQIRVESKEGEGSTFIFTIPRSGGKSALDNREPSDDVDDRMQEGREDHESSDDTRG